MYSFQQPVLHLVPVVGQLLQALMSRTLNSKRSNSQQNPKPAPLNQILKPYLYEAVLYFEVRWRQRLPYLCSVGQPLKVVDVVAQVAQDAFRDEDVRPARLFQWLDDANHSRMT